MSSCCTCIPLVDVMAVARVAEMVVKQEPSDPPPGHTPPEPVDPVDLEERILTLCAATPKGITDEMIMQDQPFFDAEKRRAALQRLLSQVGSLFS